MRLSSRSAEFHPGSARISLSTISPAKSFAPGAMEADSIPGDRYSPGLQQFLRPLTVGLLGLAVAVFIWGLGYKLSLYRPHPSPAARAGVAKLWLGPKVASSTPLVRAKRTAPPAFQLYPPPPRFAFSHPSGSTLVRRIASPAIALCFRSLRISPRSPPARNPQAI
ncbi:MAG TPA: hypothetical protein VGR96_10015 [Acidobacteriaceae bacterium]|nr:hypothetical protein [Acidobacteriaceae bacterium]